VVEIGYKHPHFAGGEHSTGLGKEIQEIWFIHEQIFRCMNIKHFVPLNRITHEN